MEEINLSGLREGRNEQPPQWNEQGHCIGPRRSPVVLLEKMPEDIEGLVKELKSAVEEYERLVSETKTNIEKSEEARLAAENVRAMAERLRIAAEELRASAEEGRTGSEADRVEAERLRDQAESLRVEAERLRASAEQGRSTAYTEAEAARNGLYQTAEAARNGLYQEAETARGTAYTTAEGLRDGAFEAKEATRDAANQAALNCAETLSALGPEIDKVGYQRTSNLWQVTKAGGYYDGEGAWTSNGNYDACLLELVPARKYKILQQRPDTRVRVFVDNGDSSYTHVESWGGNANPQSEIDYICPDDGNHYVLQVLRSNRYEGTPTIYAYILFKEVVSEEIGDLSRLETQSKTSVVDAVNEAVSLIEDGATVSNNPQVCISSEKFDFEGKGIRTQFLQEDAFFKARLYIRNNNTFGGGDTDTDCLLYRLQRGNIVIVTANPTHLAKIAFIKNENPSSNQAVTYANNTSAIISIAIGETKSYQIEEDCNLYVYGYKTENVECFPSLLSISQPFDFSIIDSKRNVIFGVQNGVIYTKSASPSNSNFRVCADLESGNISNDGTLSNEAQYHFNYKRTCGLIYTGEATQMKVLVGTIEKVLEYDEDSILIDYINVPLNQQTVSISDETRYVKLVAQPSSGNYCELEFVGCSSVPKVMHNHQYSETCEKFCITISETESTSIRLMLPPNYNQDTKVPLVINIGGDGSTTNWGFDIGHPDDGEDLVYLKNEGFAVMQVYPWGSHYADKYSGCGITSAFPLPICVRCYESAIEYAVTRYNIDADNIFVIGKSGGGKMAAYLAIRGVGFKIKHVFNFSPTLSLMYSGGSGANFYGWRNMFVDEYNIADGIPTGFLDNASFDTTTQEMKEFILANYGAWANCNPTWMNVIDTKESSVDRLIANEKAWKYYRNNGGSGDYPNEGYIIDGVNVKIYQDIDKVRIGNGTPLHFIVGLGDSSCPYQASVEMCQQLLNGGSESKVIILQSGGHGAADETNTKNVTPEYSDTSVSISYGWRYVAWVIKSRYFHYSATAEEFGDDIV